jgi:CRP-like cAMP-binding protein
MKCPEHPKKRRFIPSSNGSAEKALDIQTLLKHFPTLAPEKLERMARAMSLVRYERCDRIEFDPESPADIFLVLKGAIAITWRRDSHHQVLVALLAPGEIFGASSLMPEIGEGLQGYAFANSLVATINSTKLVDILLAVEMGAFRSAMEMTVGWSGGTLMRYIRMFHLSPRDRLVIVLIEIGAKFGVRDARGLILNLPITQQDLASLMRASRQEVNTNLGQLARLGAVINLKRQIILVPEKLFALLGNPALRKHRDKQAAVHSNGLSKPSRREVMHAPGPS